MAKLVPVTCSLDYDAETFVVGEMLPTAILSQFFFKCVDRSEEHTSELQSLTNLVCRLLLEKKKKKQKKRNPKKVKNPRITKS